MGFNEILILEDDVLSPIVLEKLGIEKDTVKAKALRALESGAFQYGLRESLEKIKEREKAGSDEGDSYFDLWMIMCNMDTYIMGQESTQYKEILNECKEMISAHPPKKNKKNTSN